MSRFTPVHQHLLIKAFSNKPITDEQEVKEFLLDLVKEIGMVPATEPQAKYVTEPGNEGLTFSINVCTSHITGHCWDETGLLMMDVYSCTCFDTIDTLRFIDDYWHLETLDSTRPLLYTVKNRDAFDFYDEIFLE